MQLSLCYIMTWDYKMFHGGHNTKQTILTCYYFFFKCILLSNSWIFLAIINILEVKAILVTPVSSLLPIRRDMGKLEFRIGLETHKIQHYRMYIKYNILSIYLSDVLLLPWINFERLAMTEKNSISYTSTSFCLFKCLVSAIAFHKMHFVTLSCHLPSDLSYKRPPTPCCCHSLEKMKY